MNSEIIETPVLFSVFVAGVPRPAGSKRAIPVWNRSTGGFAHAASGRPIVAVTDASKGSRDWKARVSAFASERWSDALLDGPLALSVVFTMPRPAAHYYMRKSGDVLRENAPRWHTKPPDLLKVTRAVEDALTGVVVKDDSRFAKHEGWKEYGDQPGVLIEIRRLA